MCRCQSRSRPPTSCCLQCLPGGSNKRSEISCCFDHQIFGGLNPDNAYLVTFQPFLQTYLSLTLLQSRSAQFHKTILYQYFSQNQIHCPSSSPWGWTGADFKTSHEYLYAKDIPALTENVYIMPHVQSYPYQQSLKPLSSGTRSYHVYPRLPSCSRHVLKMYCPCAEDRYRQENQQYSGNFLISLQNMRDNKETSRESPNPILQN